MKSFGVFLLTATALFGLDLGAWAAAGIMMVPLPPEQVQMYASEVLAELKKQVPNPPLKTDLDPTEALAYWGLNPKFKRLAAALAPDKTLTAESLALLTEQALPAGFVALYNLPLQGEKGPFPPEKVLTVQAPKTDYKADVFFLGVRKSATGIEAVVLSKDEQPLMTIPLKKVQGNEDIPLAARWEAGAGPLDLKLIFTLAGTYEGTLSLKAVD